MNQLAQYTFQHAFQCMKHLLGLCKWSFRTHVHLNKSHIIIFLNSFQQFISHSRTRQLIIFILPLFLQHLNKVSWRQQDLYKAVLTLIGWGEVFQLIHSLANIGLAKKFELFHTSLWKNLNKIFGQCNAIFLHYIP